MHFAIFRLISLLLVLFFFLFFSISSMHSHPMPNDVARFLPRTCTLYTIFDDDFVKCSLIIVFFFSSLSSSMHSRFNVANMVFYLHICKHYVLCDLHRLKISMCIEHADAILILYPLYYYRSAIMNIALLKYFCLKCCQCTGYAIFQIFVFNKILNFITF